MADEISKFRLGSTVLLQIVEIVRQGLAEGKDISDNLRGLELKATPGESESGGAFALELSDEYTRKFVTHAS
jgi:hypothetical protein